MVREGAEGIPEAGGGGKGGLVFKTFHYDLIRFTAIGLRI